MNGTALWKRLSDEDRGYRRLVLAVACLCAALLMLAGGGRALDRGLQASRDAIRSHAATGKLVFVEIDARSLAALDHWPWPRTYYARAVEQLNRAGASTIAFDVDFSAHSTPDGDMALARALAASRAPILLATFRQSATDVGGETIESLPLPELRPHGMLGTVNVLPDADGSVRSYPTGLVLGGMPRPSIGALLVGANGRVDNALAIDGAIEPDTIPRLSFVDLVRGKVRRGEFAGRTVLIGASAIELGDRYPVPRHGVLPGAVIQLLAAETLLQGTSPHDHGAWPPVLIVLIVLPLVLRARERRRGPLFILVGAGLLALPLVLETLSLGSVRIVPALAALLLAAVLITVGAAARAARQARTIDADTGLPNRRAMEESVDESVGDCSIAVLRVGNLGEVLGVMGRARAAELATRVAERVALAAGAALFLIEEGALAWVTSDAGEELGHAIDGIVALLRPGIELGGRRIELDVAVGVARLNRAHPEDSIGRALLAADRALASGARVQHYTDELNRALDWRLSLVAELDAAMARDEIWVAYQPKLTIATGRIEAAEALVRWRHPTRGPISPAEFIPALEESGRIFDLTLFIAEHTLRDMAAWRARGIELGVAINVSAKLPSEPRFTAAIEELLARYAIPPSQLTLEVTESVSLNDPDAAIAALERLSALGLRLSIDDYGTGQSTLSYLKRLPAREIKIDQSFVKSLDVSRSDQAMVRSTIELAHELGFKVVAEGIETESVLDLLRGYGCDVGQGWAIGRPVPAGELLQKIARQPDARAA